MGNDGIKNNIHQVNPLKASIALTTLREEGAITAECLQQRKIPKDKICTIRFPERFEIVEGGRGIKFNSVYEGTPRPGGGGDFKKTIGEMTFRSPRILQEFKALIAREEFIVPGPQPDSGTPTPKQEVEGKKVAGQGLSARSDLATLNLLISRAQESEREGIAQRGESEMENFIKGGSIEKSAHRAFNELDRALEKETIPSGAERIQRFLSQLSAKDHERAPAVILKLVVVQYNKDHPQAKVQNPLAIPRDQIDHSLSRVADMAEQAFRQ